MSKQIYDNMKGENDWRTKAENGTKTLWWTLCKQRWTRVTTMEWIEDMTNPCKSRGSTHTTNGLRCRAAGERWRGTPLERQGIPNVDTWLSQILNELILTLRILFLRTTVNGTHLTLEVLFTNSEKPHHLEIIEGPTMRLMKVRHWPPSSLSLLASSCCFTSTSTPAPAGDNYQWWKWWHIHHKVPKKRLQENTFIVSTRRISLNFLLFHWYLHVLFFLLLLGLGFQLLSQLTPSSDGKN